MFAKKTETIKFSDFMSGEYKNTKVKTGGKAVTNSNNPHTVIAGKTGFNPKKKVPVKDMMKKGVLGTAGAMMIINNPLLKPVTAFAETVPTIGSQNVMVIGDEIMKAFDPLIDFIISLSYPIAGIMLSASALLIMVNQKEKGYQMIMNAAIGYIAVQMMPTFLKILVHVGKAGLASLIVLL